MTILNIQTQPPVGQTAVTSSTLSTQSTLPNIIYILTDDTFAEVTTTGYLTNAKSLGNSFSNNQMALVYTTDNGPIWLKVVITYSGATIENTVISLVQPSSPGDVVLPTVANHLMVSTDTEGTLSNLTGTAINDGSLQAGRSGVAGTLISFPATAANGSLILAATNAGGAFNTTISNGTMGQSSVITIPDVGAATGQFVVKSAAFVSGNFPQNSGTAGLVIDSGLAVSNVVSKIAANTFSGAGQIILAKASGTEAANAVTASGNAGFITTSALTTAAGATYSITWTNTQITATSVIGLTIQGGTNTVQSIQFTCVAGSGSATLVIHNIGPTDALNGTVIIGYSVL